MHRGHTLFYEKNLVISWDEFSIGKLLFEDFCFCHLFTMSIKDKRSRGKYNTISMKLAKAPGYNYLLGVCAARYVCMCACKRWGEEKEFV